MLLHLEGHLIHGLQDRSPGATLRLEPGVLPQAEAFLADQAATRERFDRVAELIEGFETPYGMELLATVHWVAGENAPARVDPDQAVAGVAGWSERKRVMFSAEHVRLAWARLSHLGWFEGEVATAK